MPIVTGDIVRFTVRGNWLGEHCENVFHYRALDGWGSTMVEAAEAFWDFVSPLWRQLLPANVDYFQSVYAEQVGGSLLFAEYVIPVDERDGIGGWTGDLLPPNLAASVKLVPETRAIKPGSKRFVVGTEVCMANGYWTPSFMGDFEPFCALLDDTIFFAPLGIDGAEPVIYGEELPARPKKGGGTLPLRPITVVKIVAVLASTIVSTQNTRKIGRGA